MPMLLILSLSMACQHDCPEGFMRDNDGNCAIVYGACPEGFVRDNDENCVCPDGFEINDAGVCTSCPEGYEPGSNGTCSLTEAGYWQEGAEASCAWMFKCIEQAHQLYGSEAECVVELLDLMADGDDDCVYDAAQAQICLDALEAATCGSNGDFSAECDSVYTCDTGE